jgi:hypothetical protein
MSPPFQLFDGLGEDAASHIIVRFITVGVTISGHLLKTFNKTFHSD